MWWAMLVFVCVFAASRPSTVLGWDVTGRLELHLDSGIPYHISCTLTSNISTNFLRAVRFTVGYEDVTEKKVNTLDWTRQSNGMYTLNIILTGWEPGYVHVRALLIYAPGYHVSLCWQPVHRTVDASTKALQMGRPLTLTCKLASKGTAPITYKWYKSPGPTDYIHTGRQLKLPATSIHEAGAYSCSAQNECSETGKSAPVNIHVEVPFTVEEKSRPYAVTIDDLSYNITISGHPLHSPSIHMMDDTEEPTVQSIEVDGNYRYGLQKATRFTIRWQTIDTGNLPCYKVAESVDGVYILLAKFQETESHFTFKVAMECDPRLHRDADVNEGASPGSLGTGIGIGASIIVIMVLVIAGYFIKKKLKQKQDDDIALVTD